MTEKDFSQAGPTVRSSAYGAGGLADPTPDVPAARQHVLREIIGFSKRLRADGAAVPVTGSLEAARALAVVGLTDREAVAAALRGTLCTEEADLASFEELFPSFWHRLQSGLDGISTGADSDAGPERTGEEPALEEEDEHEGEEEPHLPDAEAPSMEPGEGSEGSPSFRIPTGRKQIVDERPAGTEEDRRRYSASGGRERVAAPAVELTELDLAAVDRFADALATLSGRRSQPNAATGFIDARKALRASLETGGTPVKLPKRRPRPTELSCCLLVDVSGSVLDTIDRATVLAVLGRLYHTARQCRIFFFDSGLEDVTAHFEHSRGDPASALGAAEVKWGGGTQIGGALESLRTQYPYAVDRETTVVVISDGLDVGEPESLEAGITWLAGRSAQLLWLNPLAVSPAYEPLSRGMATCLPYLDGLFGFATPADLGAVADQIERRGMAGSVGYEFDPRRLRNTAGGEL